jgi:hypothetical protein
VIFGDTLPPFQLFTKGLNWNRSFGRGDRKLQILFT